VTRPVHHPAPAIIAGQLEALAKQLRVNGDQAKLWATVLAARGYPTATLGSGARSSDTTTTVERAVGLSGDTGALTPPDGPWNGVDADLAWSMRLVWLTSTQLDVLMARLLAHASDDDPIPAGTGPCTFKGCEHFCNPRKNPNDRIKRGYCPSHYWRWWHLGRPDRAVFESMTDEIA